MGLNPDSPYQPLTQQQQHQSQPTPLQRHQQYQLNNALQQPTSQITKQTSTAIPNASHLQEVFNNTSQQPTQPSGYLASTKIMQPIPPPQTSVAVSVATAASANNWSQQSPQHVQQNVQSVNMYQQSATAQNQNWSQNPHQTLTYDNYYQQQQKQVTNNNNNMYQQQQQQPSPSQQQVTQQNPTTYFQQHPPQPATQNQTNPANFFDQSNNNSQTASADGWGDWDWNDNPTISAQSAMNQAHINTEANRQPLQLPQPQNQEQANYNNSVLADSFSTHNNNESWNWDRNENEQQLSNNEPKQMDNANSTQNNNWNWSSQADDKERLQKQLTAQVPTLNKQNNDNWNWDSINDNQQNLTGQNSLDINKSTQIESSPPPPPPTEFSSTASENHNYNTNATFTPPNNIPNTVFVTQAKPVTLPSRQYASPPSGNTPITENPPETALMPPQGFQNKEAPCKGSVAEVSIDAAVSAPPAIIVPPPAVSQLATNKNANPFKRSGVSQHHRAIGVVATSVSSGIEQPLDPAVFNIPPPPPADFANAGAVSLLEPDNNELPSQENQEVLKAPATHLTLPNATIQPPSTISLPNNIITQAPPPPNDERNQYLQTSHLSENSEEQQPDVDGLFPPPGLSRLVLGEPELEASQQRLVMGTEAPNADNVITQAAVMHLDERHADGEDTASENAVPVTSSVGQGVPSTSSTISSDRNLYMVAGESNTVNNNQHQRVVTGVELAEQREIEMDGENLEDEQIQQHHHHNQPHQQHHLQNQHQHQHSVFSAEARNEPPVEGADDNMAAPPIMVPINVGLLTDQHMDQHHHSINQLTKMKDSNPISSPNDDDYSDERLLNDRGINQNTAGSSKSRTKYENERLAAISRRRDKRSSADRYESDEYLNSEGEYSSEREERERRERDRRRNYREGSVRSDRGVNEEDDKRSRRHRSANKRDKYYYEEEERTRCGRDERERDRGVERPKTERRTQRQRGYEADSRYETEESTRFDNRKETLRRSIRRNDRNDQGADYEHDYNRRGTYRSSKRAVDSYESDRRDRRRSDKHRDPRYREDPRYDPREYDDYRKHSSRNARESDMEKEGAVPTRSGRMHHDPRHAAAAAMYSYPTGGYYDPYTAYYYQQMARTNPQAYAEWYKKYYGQTAACVAQSGSLQGASNTGQADTSLPASGNDGRESVHSGRSSAHNEVKDRSGALSLHDAEPVAQEPQRLTPCKFITEHTVVNFASGILVTVKPKYTTNGGSISNIVKLLKFKPNDETRKLFKVFPGPLVKGLTHKKTVIEFCQEQIRLGPMETTIYAKQLITNNAEKYRGSYTLMWNLLILLLKQNGVVVGTDIAELLLKNQQQFPFKTPISSVDNSLKSKSGSNSPIEDLDLTKNSEMPTEATTKPVNLEQESCLEINEKLQKGEDLDDNSFVKSSSTNLSLTEDEITEKFRNYLLYGNVNEALEWATDNNLWGHALFLASKLDRRSHANVMMKFANKLSLNDPLQTLYQLMSGRTPSSVTCVQDEKWGDWRPHLSMILSNTSQKPDLDRKAITTLGDSLFNRGDLYAAHFCYLMAQVGFGRYQESAIQETSLQQHLPKLVLLGSSHYKQFKDFAHNEAIIMTEIYEYACSLNDDKFSIIDFQPYKFLFATRLLDYGFHLKCLMYLEQTALHIARDPNKYESSFINKVYEMADRLKYYDPVLEKTIDDQQPASDDNNDLNLTSQQVEEQKWLQNLRQLAQHYKANCNTTTTTVSTALQDAEQSQLPDPNYYNQQQQIDQQFMEINKQFSELNLQYQQQTTGHIEYQQPNQQQPMSYSSEQQHQLHEQTPLDLYQQQQQQQKEQQQTLQTELPNQNAVTLQQKQLEETLPDAYQPQPQYLQPEVTQHSLAYNSNYYDPSQYNAVDNSGNNLDNQQQPANYDYWSQQQQQQSAVQSIDGNARPTISMPKSKTYDTDEESSAKTSHHQQQTSNEPNKKHQLVQQQQQKGAKKDDINKNQQQTNQNSGWFGGIWNKFSLKPKNQMILPDDKNPSIVWDPEKKKWVNTDGDENEQTDLMPPPKMSELMPQQPRQQPQISQQQQQTNQISFMDTQQMQAQQPQQPQLHLVPNSIPQTGPSPSPLQLQQNPNPSQLQAPGPAKTPTLQSNMFKMQRNRTLKNAYVDVFNPSGAPVNKAVENIMAPALPPATLPQSGFFIPGSQSSSASGADNSQEQRYQQQQPQQQDTHQFYNPNHFPSGGTGF